MKDVFYTLLVLWLIWKVIDMFNAYGQKRTVYTSTEDKTHQKKEGKTSIKYAPETKQKISDDEGEYVDFEEIK
jgi:hypothetical protein